MTLTLSGIRLMSIPVTDASSTDAAVCTCSYGDHDVFLCDFGDKNKETKTQLNRITPKLTTSIIKVMNEAMTIVTLYDANSE